MWWRDYVYLIFQKGGILVAENETTGTTDTIYGLGDLTLGSPITANYILDVQVWEEVNCHGRAEITLVPETALTMDEILKLEKQTIDLQTTDGKGVFHGIVLEVKARNANDYQEITLIGGTATFSEDLGKESAVFQDESKTLSTITGLMTSLTITLTDDLTIADILFQNKESHFDFARRIANENAQFLLVDCKTAANPVYIGNDPIDVKTLGEVTVLSMKKPIHVIEQLKYNVTTASSAQGFQFAEDILKIWDPSIGVGYQVSYDNQDKLVVSSHIQTEKGTLQNKISIVGSSGQTPSGTFACPPVPRGFIVEGEVKTVQDNTVQVEFFSTSDTMVWLPYENTLNNYCYCMPDVGDTVYVYHRPEDSTKDFAFSSRFEVDTYDDFSTPTTKVLTSENCMIQFESEELHLTGNRTDFDASETECISLKDSGGIFVTSASDILIHSDDDLIVFAGGSHSGMAATQTAFIASSTAGFVQLLTGAGIPGGVPAVTIPSGDVSTSKLDAKTAIDLPDDLESTLSELDETMTEGNTPTEKSEGKLSILSEKEVVMVVGGTSLKIDTKEFDLKSTVVMM